MHFQQLATNSKNSKAQQDALKKVISEVDAISSKLKGYLSIEETDSIVVSKDDVGSMNGGSAMDNATGSALEREKQPDVNESKDIFKMPQHSYFRHLYSASYEMKT